MSSDSGHAGAIQIVLEGAVDEQLAAAWSHVGSAPVVTFLDPFGVAALPRDVFTGRLLDCHGIAAARS